MPNKLEQYISHESLTAFCKKNHISKLALFGSAQRGELRPDSDIDLLVEFENGHTPGLFDLSRMEMELTEHIGRQVDLRTPEELSHYFRNEVIDTAELQYATA